MPRPKLVSDDQVLDATHAAMLRLGPDRFTLNDVAVAVGLSRAALVQRFTDKRRLHELTMERATQQVRDYFAAAPREVGLVPLWAMLSDLISGLGSGEEFSGYLLLAWGDLNDPTLNRLARERNELVRSGIRDRLPPGPDRDEAARLVQSVIQGASMIWLVERPEGLADYVAAETRRVLERLYPGERLD